MTASSSAESTMERACFGPVGTSQTALRRCYLATVFGLMPYRLASFGKGRGRCSGGFIGAHPGPPPQCGLSGAMELDTEPTWVWSQGTPTSILHTT